MNIGQPIKIIENEPAPIIVEPIKMPEKKPVPMEPIRMPEKVAV